MKSPTTPPSARCILGSERQPALAEGATYQVARNHAGERTGDSQNRPYWDGPFVGATLYVARPITLTAQ